MHAFRGATCLATVCITTPRSPLVQLALSNVDIAIELFTTAHRTHPRPEFARNARFLSGLREKASTRVASAAGLTGDSVQPNIAYTDATSTGMAAETLDVLGWRTRLVQRGQGHSPTTHTRGTQHSATANEAWWDIGDHGSTLPSRPLIFDTASPVPASATFVDANPFTAASEDPFDQYVRQAGERD